MTEQDEQRATEIGLGGGQRRSQLHCGHPERPRTGCARRRGVHAISLPDNGARRRSVSQLVRALLYAQRRWRRDVAGAEATRAATRRQVYKRFSHFCDLRETLFAALTDERFDKNKRPENLVEAVELLPELPPKVYIGNSFAPAVVEERRAKLRTFLQMVVALPDAAHLAYATP